MTASPPGAVAASSSVRPVMGAPAGPEFTLVADVFTLAAQTLSWYTTQDPLWGEDSPAGADVGQAEQYVSLPFAEPMPTVLLQPVMLLGQAGDHLAACGAVIRTPGTILALLTLMRPLIVSFGWICYLTEAEINTHERVRRNLNVSLQSATEAMTFTQAGTEQFVRFERRREDIERAAKGLGWRVGKAPNRKSPSETVYGNWCLEPKPPHEMSLLDVLLKTDQGASIGRDLYRVMSASTHAQQHAIYPLLDASQTTPAGPGYVHAPLGMTMRSLLLWVLPVLGALTQAVRCSCAYYGWQPLRWNSIVMPHVRGMLQLVTSEAAR